MLGNCFEANGDSLVLAEDLGQKAVGINTPLLPTVAATSGFGLGGVGTEGSARPGAFPLGTRVLDFLGLVPVSNNLIRFNEGNWLDI